MKKIISLLAVLLSLLLTQVALAAVGCTLNDPDRDVKRIFPESTGYKTSFITIKESGGQELFEGVQDELGDKFDSIYESIDVPYSFYDVLKGKELIGRIHGVNQKGTYGGMQLILATDLEGRIIDFYYQKISSPEAKRFMDKSFTSQFQGLSLNDFVNNIPDIKDPSSNNHDDYVATLRGLKKNLILLRELKDDQALRKQ